MRILAIESSCDETSAAVIEKKDNKISVISETTATSLKMHSSTGGIIPENAARMQLKFILPVIYKTLLKTSPNPTVTLSTDQEKLEPEDIFQANQILKDEIDAIALTYGPGLIGSLLVGVETAKTLAYTFNKKIIPINHLLAHVYANFITSSDSFTPQHDSPFIGLVISGGHTDLLYFTTKESFKWLGGTRDDAAGEAFDKIGRILGIPYPAGSEIEKRARLISNPTIKFKSPILNEDNFDFSFSGLKSEAMRYIQKEKLGIYSEQSNITEGNYQQKINEVCYATQKAIFDVVIKKTIKAAYEKGCKTILIGGGVSANQTLRNELTIKANKNNYATYFPQIKYSTDNAAMVGAYAALNPNQKLWKEIVADPELYFT